MFGTRDEGSSYLANGFTDNVTGYLGQDPNNIGYDQSGTALEVLPNTGDVVNNLPVSVSMRSPLAMGVPEWTGEAEVDLTNFTSTDNTRIGTKGVASYSEILSEGDKTLVDNYLE